MKFSLVFPGQGAQSLGMMSAYFGPEGENPVVRQAFTEASEALGYDLWAVVTDGPAETLNQTVYTQPAMLTAGIAALRLWQAKGGAAPALVAGHSLGEYTALVAAGVIDLQTAVKLVEFRAKAMQGAVPVGVGSMAAIVGLDADSIVAACAAASQGQVVQAVNFNTPEQTVIAGNVEALQRACDACKVLGAKRALMLTVSAPFHSSLLDPAAEQLRGYLADIPFSAPKLPLVNNIDVRIENDPERIKDALVRQAAGPVRWVETMQFMAEQGITHVYECGPCKVLTGFTARCVKSLAGAALSDLAAMDAALLAVQA